MRGGFLIGGLLGTVVVAHASEPPLAPVPPDAPRSVYRLDLAVDIPVSAVAAAGMLVPYALTDTIIHPRCPCPESDGAVLAWAGRW